MVEAQEGSEGKAVRAQAATRDSLAVLSVAGVLITAIISATNIYTTFIQRDKELEIQSKKNSSDQKIAHGQMILANIKQLNSDQPNERELAVAAIVWTLGQDEADKLFSSVEQFGPSEVQDVAQSARATIANAKAWEGNWKHSFSGSRGTFHGNMTLRSQEVGAIVGEYEIHGSVKGVVSGTLTEDGRVLNGRWERAGQRGRFFFEIDQDKRSFHGKYSMLEGDPRSQSGQDWTGTKLSE